jgi:hypothetical protein
MPPRVSHLPNYAERSALDKLRHDRELSLAQLHPTGSAAVAKMIQKGWIERAGSKAFRITAAGRTALTARLPDRQPDASASVKPSVPET